MTLLELVNKVLRRLREEEVAALSTSDYARLIGEFASDIHQDVALEHDWTSGYKEAKFDCVVNQRTYNLAATTANGGDIVVGNSVTNAGSEPATLGQAYVYESSSSTEPKSTLVLVDPAVFQNIVNEDTDAQNVPCYASLKLKSDGTGYEVDLYPRPDSTYRIKIPMWIPETLLETDGTDDSTSIQIPTRPIYLGTLFLALNERGEEIGEPGNIAETNYIKSLAQAVASDIKARSLTNRYDWNRD